MAAPPPDANLTAAIACSETAAFTEFKLPPDNATLVLASASSSSAWLELKEIGQSVDVVGARPAERLQVRVPPRYSWSFVPLAPGGRLELRRFDATRAAGRVAATLHCTTDAVLQRRIDWFRSASAVSSALRAPSDDAGYARIVESIESLQAAAPDRHAQALALHLRAQALLVNGHNADASDQFARVDAAWSAIGETERALAARVGRAEDAIHAARYRSVLDLVPDAPAANAIATGYFGVRLQASRCLALWYIDQLADAARCYRATMAGFDALGETTEYANILENYADLQSQMGDIGEAERLARRALGLARGHNPRLTLIRLEQLLGSLALRRGSVVEALGYFDAALTEVAAAHEARRWAANVEMHISRIYEELGAYDEALGHLANAVKGYSMRDAPARMAEAMLRFSRLESDVGHDESARLWAHAAEAAYTSLQMPAERDAARIAALALQLRHGDSAGVREAVGRFGSLQATERVELDLIDADAAVRTRDVAAARAKLDDLGRQSLSLRQRVELAQVEARYWNGVGQPQRALDRLAGAAEHVRTLARTTRNRVLASVLARQLLPLRRAAMQTILGDAGASDRVASTLPRAALDAIWSWLAIDALEPAERRKPDADGAAEARFDLAVAAELLAPPARGRSAVGSATQRDLLALMSQPAAAGSTAAPAHGVLPLADFQARLPRAAAFIAYLDAGDRGALLWVTRDEARLMQAGTPDAVRNGARALRDLLSSPSSPVDRIAAAAKHLSGELLGGIANAAAPEQLVVLTEEPLNGIAWSVLPWPVDGAPLIERTGVRLASFTTDMAAPAADNRVLHVIAAAQQRTGQLTALGGAAVEPRLIAGAATGRRVVVSDGANATRTSTLAALGEAGAWVHVAAHGVARPQRIGYAGIWLEPATPGDAPMFLSWLEVLEAGVNADVVVLNACDLDERGSAIDANLSFAAAVSHAGAHWVLAAMWPVSDAASALWVPEFYAAAGAAGAPDVASSLRAAQLRLRATTAFRHPFFWAGMQATERWVIADAGRGNHVATAGIGAH